MPDRTPITVAYGDGIGPEIMEAVFKVLDAAGARLAPEVIEIGEKVYKEGHTAGIRPGDWESLRRTRVFLKSPITTPSGGGYKSRNVTIRKTLGLYANVRPCVSYAPFVPTRLTKMTDGLFRRVFDEIRTDYPEIETDHHIIDIGAARLATRPDRFDVVVTLNLYGDILSAIAERVHNAWLRTIEDGVYTAELRHAQIGRPFGSMDFADAVVQRLGFGPEKLPAVRYTDAPQPRTTPRPLYQRRPPARKSIVGVDVFVNAAGVSADYLAGRLQTLTHQPRPAGFELQMITNRGVKVWPGGFPETFCTDHWRCRFVGVDASGAPREITHADIVALLHNLESDRLDFIKTETLCTFDGEAGYALGQGQ